MNNKEKISDIIGSINDDIITESANMRGKAIKNNKKKPSFYVIETAGSIFAVFAIICAVIFVPALLKNKSGSGAGSSGSGLIPIPGGTDTLPTYATGEYTDENCDSIANIQSVFFNYKSDGGLSNYYTEEHKKQIFMIQSKEELDAFVKKIKEESMLIESPDMTGLSPEKFGELYSDEYFEKNDLILFNFRYRPGNYIVNGLTKVTDFENNTTELRIEMSGAYDSELDFYQNIGIAVEIYEKLPENTEVKLCYVKHDPQYTVLDVPHITNIIDRVFEDLYTDKYGNGYYDDYPNSHFGIVINSEAELNSFIANIDKVFYLENYEFYKSEINVTAYEKLKKMLSKYTDEYFLNNSLVIAPGALESGGYFVEFNYIEYVHLLEGVHVNFKISGDGITDDMKYFAFLIECSGKIPLDANIRIDYTEKYK